MNEEMLEKFVKLQVRFIKLSIESMQIFLVAITTIHPEVKLKCFEIVQQYELLSNELNVLIPYSAKSE